MEIDIKLVLILLFITAGCSGPVAQEESSGQAKVSVEVTGISKGIIKDELTLSASTLYLNRNVVVSPIPSYITHVHVKLGESVKKGQLLFELETKESKALGSDTGLSDIPASAFGKISIYAPASGTINILDKQQVGDYVMEGTQMCVIAESNTLAFGVNVPYEYIEFTKRGRSCTIVLPDNSTHLATFTAPLTTMNAADQTQTFLAKTKDRLFLPENLIVKVLLNRGSDEERQILPKTAVLSDEMMEKFWVMMLLNDSIAVKKEITPGTGNNESVEIIEPQFNERDRFLVSGNYGLPDTAVVKVINSSKE
jgi:hypothetical protein